MNYIESPVCLKDHKPVVLSDASVSAQEVLEGKEKTMAYRILRSHEMKQDASHAAEADPDRMHIRFDALISHDITYVGIIQTARASGMKAFKIPYVLTNCHNSLCAVGGTINEDDHVFGLSAAQKYGGEYVPASQAVIHQYAREVLAGCGKMILGSDSHTRYGAYGTMGIGEGGPELVKQLLDQTYDIPLPQVTLVYVTGSLKKGVGPHDVALTLCRDVFGTVKNHILEFAGPGIAGLSTDERIGIDVMTTETSCLSSIWETDEKVREFYRIHGREEAYEQLGAMDGAVYDHMIELKLDEIEPMIALPFHPSNAVPIRELKQDPHRYLDPIGLGGKIVDGKILVDQGVIAGCAGGLYENLKDAAGILKNADIGCGNFTLTVYPASTPIQFAAMNSGILSDLVTSGAVLKPCFCGPCFGAGDVPQNEGFSIRHTTRNFPNREGSKPGEGQKAYVALMDARSIAATALNHGVLTGADEETEERLDAKAAYAPYQFNPAIYEKRVYHGIGKPMQDTQLIMGPNITDWPKIEPLKEDMLLKLSSVIRDPVTTTDELIPSGETSSYRSNPLRLAEFTLSRRDPAYVGRAKAVQSLDIAALGYDPEKTSLGSAVFANKPGDGSAREQAASCQRVLGGAANLALEYATKRYRSNLINWGMVPFTVDAFDGEVDDLIYIPGIRKALLQGEEAITGYQYRQDHQAESARKEIRLYMKGLSDSERQILLDGCLMNYYNRGLQETKE
ncbi:MAG: hydratase [Firmicutes bacterium]|nr:hydratase [Bacillota bacterium]